MRKILSIIFCICIFCSCLTGCTSKEELVEHTYSIADMEGKYKTQGRTDVSAKGLSLSHTATSFEFNAYCKGEIALEINASSIPEESGYGVYFSVYVDNELQRDRIVVKKNEKQTLVIAEELEEGEHLIQLFRQTENKRGNVTISALAITGELLDAPEENEIFVEFIGDGLTTGVGNQGGGTMSKLPAGVPLYQDGTQSYAFLTAQYLGADLSVVAEESVALLCCEEGNAISDIYDYFPNTISMYQATRTPDIIVVNLGTNDYLNRFSYEKSLTDIKNELAAFVKVLKEKHPQAKIVLVSGMMEDTLKKYVMEVVDELGGEQKDLYYQQLVLDTNGTSGYSSEKGHEQSAAVLADFLKQKFGL